MRFIRTLILTIALLLGLSAFPALAADDLGELTWQAPESGETAQVKVQQVDGRTWLFLPASADLSALTLTFGGGSVLVTGPAGIATLESGIPFNLSALFEEPPADGRWTVTLTRGGDSTELMLMKSENLRALWLASANTQKGRDWVEQSKDNKAKGQAVLLRADGTQVWAGELKQIKGRGNTTWYNPKKPYQIKLGEKVDLLETGLPSEEASTWVLLANYCDATLLHNTFTYDLARDFALPFTPYNTPVDLYYDGEYRGSYLLCEKTEVGEARVDIFDLGEAIEEANPDAGDLGDLPTIRKTDEGGRSYQYVDGITLPEDYSGGYLLEMDFQSRAEAEASWFSTTAGCYVVCKSPEYLPEEGLLYIRELYQAFEDAVMNGGTHPITGLDYSEYMDVESLARCYLMLELSQDGDAFRSSTYFYKLAGEEKLYAGPLWDFDSSYGSYVSNFAVDQVVAGETVLGRALWDISSFREALRTAYQELYPLVESERNTLQESRALLAASQRMDHVLWPEITPGSYRATVEELRSFLAQRNAWFYERVVRETSYMDLPGHLVDVRSGDWFAGAVGYVTDRGIFKGTSLTRFSPEGTMTRAMMVTALWRLAGEPELPAEETPAPAPAFPESTYTTGDAAGTESTTSVAPTFSDVEEGTWYSRAVAWAAASGVVMGYPDGTFGPDRPVTRQEVVSFFFRVAKSLGEDLSAPTIPETFIDRNQVPDWAAEAFGWAIDRGLLTGTSAGTLDPEGLALRSQGAALFQRFHTAYYALPEVSDSPET